MRKMRKGTKIVLAVLLGLVLLVGAYAAYVFIDYHRIEDYTVAELTHGDSGVASCVDVDEPSTRSRHVDELSMLREHFAGEHDSAYARNYDGPYNPNQLVLTVDGFLVSANVVVHEADVVDLGFAYSDHNPVKMTFELKG